MSEPSEIRSPDRWLLTCVWAFAGILLLYFGLFAILMIDGPVLHTDLIEGSIRRVSPELHSAVGDVLKIVYFPLIKLVEFAGLV